MKRDMVRHRPTDGVVRTPEHEFQATQTRAAEEDATRALADVGIEGDETARHFHALRSMSMFSGSCAAPRPTPASASPPPESGRRSSPASPSS